MNFEVLILNVLEMSGNGNKFPLYNPYFKNIGTDLTEGKSF